MSLLMASVRHTCMDSCKVGRYFEKKFSLMQRTGFSDKPKQLWNMDETDLQLEHKPRRVTAQKGVKDKL